MTTTMTVGRTLRVELDICEETHEKETFDSIGVYLCSKCKRVFWQISPGIDDAIGGDAAVARVGAEVETLVQQGWEVI